MPVAESTINELLLQFASIMGVEGVNGEDLKAIRASLVAPSPHDELIDDEADAKFDAQQLAFEAMEAKSKTSARKLAKRALRLDPDCVDALLILNDLDSRTQAQRIEGLQRAVAAGKRSLGATFVENNRGNFWLLIETRPYMRAMETLGGELAAKGIKLEAVTIYEEMLSLNPRDNQGVRDPLLGLYLAAGDQAGAKRLSDRYPRDGSACFAWGRLLERLLAGDHKRANAALRKAVEANPYVALHLIGQQKLPKGLPDMYSLGSSEEAMLCQHYLGAAWAAQPEALLWVSGRLAAMTIIATSTKGASRKNDQPDAGPT